MADDTLTAFTINSLLIGLLIMGMITAYVLIVNNEGHGDMFDSYPEIENYNLNLTNSYSSGRLLETANINSNISANYDPEISQSGSDKSGNAISINLQNLASLAWTSLGFLGGLLFGNVYTGILSAIIISIVGYFTVSLVIKAIRTGYT